MLKIKTLADLQALVDDEIQESLFLDYKSSPALGKANDKRNELIKDVSSFANSAGGQIIYGVVERGHKPIQIDGGTDITIINREWIEQTINSNIQPRISGLEITSIPISDTTAAFVIEIPAARTLAPHQSTDKKYYKRFNYQSIPMEDYEIRDVFRRADYAEPFALFAFDNDKISCDVSIDVGTNQSTPIQLKVTAGNNSSQPAYYSIFRLYVDCRLGLINSGSFDSGGKALLNMTLETNVYSKKIGIPGSFPLFKEMTFLLSEPSFSFYIPKELIEANINFLIGYEFITPGCHVQQFGRMSLEGHVLTMQMPPTLTFVR